MCDSPAACYILHPSFGCYKDFRQAGLNFMSSMAETWLKRMELKNRDDGAGSISPTPGAYVREFFDHQAAKFDERAGLPEIFAPRIARAVMDIGGVRDGDLVVELGPGTGQIGLWFRAPVRYAGVDLSPGMLREFRARLGRELDDNRALIHADAASCWPLADASARLVFSSRTVHLLNQEHVAAEFIRVAARDGATFIVGRTRREPQSTRARMAREMNERLRLRGFKGRGGQGQSRELFEACSRRGAEILEPVEVARWTVRASPQKSLDSWRSLVSLGGIKVPAEVRAEILMELEGWAAQEFGALDRETESEETYVLYPIRY